MNEQFWWNTGIVTIVMFIVYNAGVVIGYILWKRRNPRLAIVQQQYEELYLAHTNKKYECGELKEELQELKESINKAETKNYLLETYLDIFIDRKKIRNAIEIEKKINKGKYWWE